MGCYNDCYAARISRIYGYDFSKSVLRYFKNEAHLNTIKKQIDKVKLPFIRMGTMGDPSEYWEHTINTCIKLQYEKQLKLFKETHKEIVIITKHWLNLDNEHLSKLKELNVCINTSISALDDINVLNNCINQFETLKKYCRSVLRIVSFDFNIENEQGYKYALTQKDLFDNYNMLDTVFRSSKNNPLVKDGIIKIKESKFLGKRTYISKFNRKTYFGNCNNCIEQCGVNM